MARPQSCRIIIDPQPNSGAWNMAVDEALLESALERCETTVRWYQWEEPTISLGYFQEFEAAEVAPELADRPVVRRLTGGGAILHHHELTYSCTLPGEHPLAITPLELYERVHACIVELLAVHGVDAQMRGVSESHKDKTFLCFGRGDPRDVICCGLKILGSAQRRRRGAIVQHGSLLLRQSPLAPQYPGVLDLQPETSFDEGAVGELARRVAAVCGHDVVTSELSETERGRAAALVEERYQSIDWRRAKAE